MARAIRPRKAPPAPIPWGVRSTFQAPQPPAGALPAEFLAEARRSAREAREAAAALRRAVAGDPDRDGERP